VAGVDRRESGSEQREQRRLRPLQAKRDLVIAICGDLLETTGRRMGHAARNPLHPAWLRSDVSKNRKEARQIMRQLGYGPINGSLLRYPRATSRSTAMRQ
jgi:hypothetical protein